MQINGGIYKSRRLFQPKGLSTRPSLLKLRSALFNMVQNRIAGALFLDLFAGVGAMGLEALSRGGSEVWFIEKDIIPFQLIKKNAAHLGCQEKCRFLLGDVLQILKKEFKVSFDIIFADPPYGLKWQEKSSLLYTEKLLEEIAYSSLLKEGGDLFVEEGVSSLKYPEKAFLLSSQRSYGGSTLYHFLKRST